MTAVCLPAEISHDNATGLSGELLARLKASAMPDWHVDASCLREFDSSVLSVLLQLQREAAQSGRALHVSGACEKLRKLADLYGVAELM